MSIQYLVRTGTSLPRAKRFFDCRCKAINFIKSIVDTIPKGVSKEDILSSFQVLRIDDDLLPEYKKLFKENELEVSLPEKSTKNNFTDDVQ